ncbi:catalase, partial [Priestia megaterium]|uniref:catalase n=1 Tax=Priestia megaterium TaxID=1404 RepID=UPI0012B6E9C9
RMGEGRGFGVKLYREEGKWELVGNKVKIFFIRDGIKLVDVIDGFKGDGVRKGEDREGIFDFICDRGEGMDMISFLF